MYPLRYLNLFSRVVILRLVDLKKNSRYQIGFAAFDLEMSNIYLLQCFFFFFFKGHFRTSRKENSKNTISE